MKGLLYWIPLVCMLTCPLIHCKRSRKLEDETCKPSEYHYDFTECDTLGGRWRVAIPSLDCEGMTPTIAPKRLNSCFKSCEAGQFLNLTTVECEDCELGTYSMGGGIRFEVWDPLPNGFKSEVEKFHSMFSAIGRQYSGVNCSKWGWRPRGNVLLSQGGPCVATLIYSAQLVKPGSLKFTYQYSDDSVLFQFQANSERCESIREAEGSRWPPLTGEGVWRTEEIALHAGLNIFQWKTMGIDSHRPKPILIKKIEIEGVGYTSSCNPCPAGTFSNKLASKTCTACPKNTYSGPKSKDCIPCNEDEYYSDIGSSECKIRPACSDVDYYQIHTLCDHNNQTRIIHKWVQPKICLETREGSVVLPPPGVLQDCPPCNPGTVYRDGNCQPCPQNQFSDGLRPCSNCPPNMVSDTGYQLTHWYSWPPNVHTTCISPEDTGCNLSPAWQLNGNYVRSGKGHADWVYLVMTLSVAGFRGRGGVINGEIIEVGRLSFSFEMKCSNDCELLLMQGTSSKNASVIQRWTGKKERKEFVHEVVRNDTYNFSWAFQKVAWDSTNSDDVLREERSDQSSWTKPSADSYVKIYNITVTNSIDGGASSCVPCHEGLIYNSNSVKEQATCVTCNPGQYRIKSSPNNSTTQKPDKVTSQCRPCPDGTVTIDPFATNSSSCRPCGPGLTSTNGVTCSTDCLVHLGGRAYDLRPLKGYHTVRGSSLFTASGTQYYHVFNISFCAVDDAQCFKNVSLQGGYGNQYSQVSALVCQSTIFPPGMGLPLENGDLGVGPKPVSTHASSLGDHLLGISHSASILNVTIADDIHNIERYPNQFHFFYSTPEPTIACSKGRSTTLTFRCRIPTNSWSGVRRDTETSKNEIKAPEKCPDATCDGCNFHFIWETPFACHLCKENELTIVRGECKEGSQELHYLPSPQSQCLLVFNSSWPVSQKCRNHLPFVVEVAIQFAVGLTALLSILLLCFWHRHRNLEYKYMKLVASGSNCGTNSFGNLEDSTNMERDMLPIAESCALGPDEQEDEDDNLVANDGLDPRVACQGKEVSFYSDSAMKSLASSFSILEKIRSFTRKTGNASKLEIMNLTDKEALS